MGYEYLRYSTGDGSFMSILKSQYYIQENITKSHAQYFIQIVMNVEGLGASQFTPFRGGSLQFFVSAV